jgi:hypothetical protein
MIFLLFIYLFRVVCLSSVSHNNQADQGDETEGLQREGVEGEGLEREDVKRLFIV